MILKYFFLFFFLFKAFNLNKYIFKLKQIIFISNLCEIVNIFVLFFFFLLSIFNIIIDKNSMNMNSYITEFEINNELKKKYFFFLF